MRRAALAPLVVLLPLVARPQGREVPSFPAEARLVTVDALVLDRDGKPVAGLGPEDFVVTEDGVPQPIVSFEAFDLGPAPAAPVPGRRPDPVASNLAAVPRDARSFVLLVDDMSLAPHRTTDVRRAIGRLLDEGLRDGDEVLLATTSGDVWWSARMPEGREDVRALVARVRGRRLAETATDFMSEWEAFRISRVDSPTGAGLDSAGVPPSPEGPPAGGGGGSGAAAAAPGSNMTERVVSRWLERRACDPLALGLCRSMVVQRAQGLDRARANRTRDVMARIDRAVFVLSRERGRKALLLLTEGFLNDPDLDVVRLVAGRCREANIAVHSLDVRGLQGAVGELSASSIAGAPNSAEIGLMRQEQLEFESAGSAALAEDTGGFALRDTNDLGGGAVRIADESRVYYLLGIVSPPGKGPRDWRSIQVSTKRAGLRVRARRGYTLRTAADIDREERASQAGRSRRGAAESGEPPPLEVSRALAGGSVPSEIPLRAMAFVFGSRPEGRVQALLALEIDMRRVANLGGEDRPATALSLSIAVAHRDTGEMRRVDQQVRVDAGEGGAAFDGWLLLRREFELRPGVNQARAVVRDEFLGRTGAVTLRFEVPPPEGLRLSTPILTNRSAVGRAGEPPRPVFVARRAFPARGILHAQYEVFGAAAAGREVEASYELRRGDGATVRRGVPSRVDADAGGRLVHLLRLSLDGLPPGDYELRLRVEDAASGEVAEQTEAVRLEPSSP